MACDTFLKICNKCRRKFVVLQVQEREPFICELLTALTDTIQDLQPHQIHTFYEAVGLMIGAESDPVKRDDYLVSGGEGTDGACVGKYGKETRAHRSVLA